MLIKVRLRLFFEDHALVPGRLQGGKQQIGIFDLNDDKKLLEALLVSCGCYAANITTCVPRTKRILASRNAIAPSVSAWLLSPEREDALVPDEGHGHGQPCNHLDREWLGR